MSDTDLYGKIKGLLTPKRDSEAEIEAKKEKSQRDFELLWDYDKFKAEILKIAQSSRNDSADDWNLHCISDKFGYNPYLEEFIIQFSGWMKIDSDNVVKAIENEEAYRLFRLEKTIENLGNRYSMVDISEGRIREIAKEAEDLLMYFVRNNKIYNTRYLQAALKLFVNGYLHIEDDVLAGLLDYSYESVAECDSTVPDTEQRDVFAGIQKAMDKDRFLGLLREYVYSGRIGGNIGQQKILKYLMHHGDDSDRKKLYEMMVESPQTSFAYYLLDGFLGMQPYKETILNDFDKFAFEDQMRIWESVEKDTEAEQRIIQKIEEGIRSFSDFHKKIILRKLTKKRSRMALDMILENPEDLMQYGEFYYFSYTDPAALSQLFEVLRLLDNGDKDILVSIRRSEEASVGNIASQSDDLLEQVKSKIKDFSVSDAQYCRRFEDYCQRQRMEARDNE